MVSVMKTKPTIQVILWALNLICIYLKLNSTEK
jgi:hypothetical protein